MHTHTHISTAHARASADHTQVVLSDLFIYTLIGFSCITV